jgi:hypothetical protein
MVDSRVVQGASPTTGWLYMLPYWEDESPSSTAKGVIMTGGGSGFVVFPHYVLTHELVARNAAGLSVFDPNDLGGAPLSATLVATADESGLAILRCEQLEAPPVALHAELPGQREEISVFGYPKMFQLGTRLEAARGTMVALPDTATDQRCLYSAVTTPGDRGGPVSNLLGRVVAMHSTGYDFGGKVGAGIPTSTLLAFLAENIPEFAPQSADATSPDWEEVGDRMKLSTVLIVRHEATLENLDIVARAGHDYLEDKSCCVCKGLGKVHCPWRACKNGKVATRQWQVTGRNAATGDEVGQWNRIMVDCGKCREGFVDCKDCSNGTDRQL